MAPDRRFVKPKQHEKCPECHVILSHKTDLWRHMKTHTRDKKHHCPYSGCSFETVQKPNLTTHLRQHGEGAKPQCPDCDFSCNDPGSLTRHRRAIHQYQPQTRKSEPPHPPPTFFATSSSVPQFQNNSLALAYDQPTQPPLPRMTKSFATPSDIGESSLGGTVSSQHLHTTSDSDNAHHGRDTLNHETTSIVSTVSTNATGKMPSFSPPTIRPPPLAPSNCSDKQGPLQTLPYPISYPNRGTVNTLLPLQHSNSHFNAGMAWEGAGMITRDTFEADSMRSNSSVNCQARVPPSRELSWISITGQGMSSFLDRSPDRLPHKSSGMRSTIAGEEEI